MFTATDIFRNIRTMTANFERDIHEHGFTAQKASERTAGTIRPDGTINPDQWTERWDGIRTPLKGCCQAGLYTLSHEEDCHHYQAGLTPVHPGGFVRR